MITKNEEVAIRVNGNGELTEMKENSGVIGASVRIEECDSISAIFKESENFGGSSTVRDVVLEEGEFNVQTQSSCLCFGQKIERG